MPDDRASTSLRRQRVVLLEAIYSVPNPFDTFEQMQRFQHQDLTVLSQSELLHERERLRFRLTLSQNRDSGNGWLLERLARLEEVLVHA